MPIYMKIEGIPGESYDPGYELQHNVNSYSWGMSNPSVDNGGSGKASFSDLSLMMHVGKASPSLMLHCAKGTHFPKATLTVRKSGDDQQAYLVITLEDCLISSYQLGGDGGDTESPMASTSFSYSKIEFKAYYRKADGSTGISRASWDLKTNTGG